MTPESLEDSIRSYVREAIKGKVNEKEDDDPCWKGYRQYGTKTKNGKKVPNCVPEEVNESMTAALAGAAAGFGAAGAVEAIRAIGRHIRRNDLSRESQMALRDFTSEETYIDMTLADEDLTKPLTKKQAEELVKKHGAKIVDRYDKLSASLHTYVRLAERIMRDPNYDRWNDRKYGYYHSWGRNAVEVGEAMKEAVNENRRKIFFAAIKQSK